MRVNRRDFIAIAAVVLLAAVLIIAGTGREKAKVVPPDQTHRPFYEAIEKGADRSEIERGCPACHNAQANPLPKKHPPKEQCLICHRLARPR
jgi:cytochrome c5